MKEILYNDIKFSVEKTPCGWNIFRTQADGGTALVGAGLYPDLPDDEAEIRARALIKTVYPVGIKTVGPDVAHPNLVGDLKIVGPDVAHPNFIYWDKNSSSFAK